MEILYLYVDSYKNISDSEYFFYKVGIKYNREKNRIELNNSFEEISEKVEKKANFYSESKKIKNITAIIGSNGSGKTILLNFLGKITSSEREYDESFKNSKYILLIRENNKIKLKTNIKNIKFPREKIEEIDETFYYPVSIHDSKNIEKFDCDYYLSNNSIFRNFTLTASEFKFSGPVYTIFSKNNYKLYKWIEELRELQKVKEINENSKINLFDIKLPSKIILETYIETFGIEYFSKEREVYYSVFPKVNFFGSDDSLFFLEHIFLYLIKNIYNYESHFSNGNLYSVKDKEKIEMFFMNEENKEKRYLQIANLMFEHSRIDILDIEEIQKEIEWLIKNRDKFDTNLIEIGKNKWERILKIELTINKEVNKTLENIKFLLEEGKLFNFQFDIKFSSGEENILFFAIKFHEILKRRRRIIAKRDDADLISKSFVLYLDEGETFLHPEWQRKYIWYLIQIIEKFLAKDENIQVFLSSHSPFLISDLPVESIIFLGEDKKEKMAIGERSTFGANIHELLINSFFMKSTMGEFAREKIGKIIEKLKSEDEIMGEQQKKEIKNTIEIIGEPLIKKKLLQLYEKKYNNTLDNKIEKLKKEIKILELRKANQVKN